MHQALWYIFSAAIAAAILVITFWMRFLRSQYYLLGSKIPGPAPFPLLGNLHIFAAQTNRILKFIKELECIYGSTYRLWFGTHLVVVTCNPKHVEMIVSNKLIIDKPFFYRPLRKLWGCGLSSAPIDSWKKHRKIMNPVFTTRVIEEFLEIFNTTSEILVDVMRDHVDGQPFDLLDHLLKFMIDNTTQTTLGTAVNFQSGENVELVEDFLQMKKIVGKLVLEPISWLHSMNPLSRELLSICDRFREFAQKIIKEKEENFDSFPVETFREPENMQSSKMNKKCLITYVLSQLRSKSFSMTKKALQEQTIHITLAAMDTSAIAISTVLKLLGLHQDVQSKVLEELRSVFREDRHRPVTLEDLRTLVYMEQVIKESLRLFPPLPIIARRAQKDIKIEGYMLPAGSTVAISIYQMHRDPRNFPRPEEFDPGRFDPINCHSHHPYSFMPFSTGPRDCIGRAYSSELMKVVLSTILRQFEVLPCDSREDMESLNYKVTIEFRHGYKIKLRPRVW